MAVNRYAVERMHYVDLAMIYRVHGIDTYSIDKDYAAGNYQFPAHFILLKEL
jgi:hypothetical protein